MKNFILFMIFFLLTENLLAQNVFNPYQNYNGLPMPSYLVPLPVGSSITDFPHSSIISNGFSNYAGEYMIQFDQLPWFWQNSPTFGLAKSYKVEVIGFPFVMNCAQTATGCADGSTTTRNLEMPDDPLINEQWGTNVWRKRDDILIDLNSPKPLGEPSDIISYMFKFDYQIPTGQPFYPHTAHKFTVYLHCGSSINNDIIDSLVFYYDNTRGRMRDYPFMQINQGGIGIGSDNWDVVFRPRLIYQNYDDGHYYNKSSNEDLFDRGKTINYFPFISDLGGCDQQFPGNLYYDTMNDAFLGMHPAPYTLTTFLLYFQYTYNQFAGYDLNNGILTLNEGIRHTYHVQNNIDLTFINPDEKVIYNPSEVIVDPDAGDPQGNFDVQPGSDVTFEAGDVIHLTNGFQVSGGSFSAFTNTNIPVFPVCYDAQRLMPNQPKGKKQKPLADMQEFTISPNPSSTGVFNLRFRNLPFNGELSVFNAMGAEVKRIENIRQTNLTVSVEDLAKGIYMFRYREGAEKYQTIRVVIN